MTEKTKYVESEDDERKIVRVMRLEMVVGKKNADRVYSVGLFSRTLPLH